MLFLQSWGSVIPRIFERVYVPCVRYRIHIHILPKSVSHIHTYKHADRGKSDIQYSFTSITYIHTYQTLYTYRITCSPFVSPFFFNYFVHLKPPSMETGIRFSSMLLNNMLIEKFAIQCFVSASSIIYFFIHSIQNACFIWNMARVCGIVFNSYLTSWYQWIQIYRSRRAKEVYMWTIYSCHFSFNLVL